MILKEKESNSESEMSISELSPGGDYDDFYLPSKTLSSTFTVSQINKIEAQLLGLQLRSLKHTNQK